MKKKILISIIFLFVVLFVAYLYTALTSAGFYDSNINKIYCKKYSSCLHEIGHKTDDEMGWISKTAEWEKTVNYYRVMIYYYPEKRDNLSHSIEFFYGVGWKRIEQKNIFLFDHYTGWGGYTELYAYILSEAGGEKENVPEMLRDFYNWNRIAELKEQYNGKNIY